MLATNPLDGLVFAPVIEPTHDDAFLTEKSHELLSTGEFNQVPSIIGFNSLEGYLPTSGDEYILFNHFQDRLRS